MNPQIKPVPRIVTLALALCLAGLAFPEAHASNTPWPAAVPGHVAVKPGEHPRLFFRKSDLPALRAKARTPEGQAIIARLKVTLGGGEAMPTSMRPVNAPFGDGSPAIKQPLGAYSIGHAAGFGLLYQLTGEKKYADLGRKCFELAFEGVRDRDDSGRYGWKGSSGALRAGPSLGWYAVGYDLCYDGWDDAFRTQVAQAIANYNEGKNTSLAELAKGSRHMPASNHWGMQVGGAALALLAIMDDPGVDMNKIRPLLATSQKSMIRNMTEGFGDGAFFGEGDGTGSMASHIVFLPALQAWKIAAGKDFITPRPNAKWLTLRWPFLTTFKGGKSSFWPQRGGYPHNIWAREGLSGAGYFAYGFGALPDEYKPGMLWYYDTFLKENDARMAAPFDTVSIYPQVSVLAFINWPLGTRPENPSQAWPMAFRDTCYGFYAWRNRYQDENDVIITILTKTAKGYMQARAESSLSIKAHGKQLTFGKINKGFTGDFNPAKDGSTSMVTGDGTMLAIDFSKTSGSDAVIVMNGPGASGGERVTAGELTYHVLQLGAGAAKPRAEGDRLIVGDQHYRVESGKIVIGH